MRGGPATRCTGAVGFGNTVIHTPCTEPITFLRPKGVDIYDEEASKDLNATSSATCVMFTLEWFMQIEQYMVLGSPMHCMGHFFSRIKRLSDW